MIDDHVTAKIKEALEATDGNRHDAQKLLITWAVRDQMLLLGMAKPHLKAISAALIDHALRPRGGHDPGPDHIPQSTIDEVIAASGSMPRDKRSSKNVPPPKSTERQARTMHKLAAAFKRNKKK